jgi:hypothetical protein
MKNQTIYRIVPAALFLFLFASVAVAQDIQVDQEKAAREKEMKAKQEQLEMQHQEMVEQQIKVLDLRHVYEEQARVSARESSRERSSARVYTTGSDEGSYFVVSSGQENQSQLTLRNSFDGTTDSSAGEFDVDESTTHIRCMINGKVRAGKITVKVIYPGGKVFKNLSINSSAEISFTQSLTIKGEDKKKYVGSWTYEITAEKAEGNYMLSFMTH